MKFGKIVSLFLLIILSLCSGCTTEPKKLSAIIRILEDGKTNCSGVVLNRYFAMTAAHCKRDPADTTVMIMDKDKKVVIQVQIVSTLARVDQMLLMGDFSKFATMKIGNIQNDNNLTNCGYSYGGSLNCYKYQKMGQTQYFYLKGQGYMYPGMSGGPLFNAETMTVYGVNTAVYEDGTLIHSPLINVWTIHNVIN